MATTASNLPADNITMPVSLTDQVVVTTKTGNRVKTRAVFQRSPVGNSAHAIEFHALLIIDTADLPVYLTHNAQLYQTATLSYTQTRDSAMAVMRCFRGVNTDDSDYKTQPVPRIIEAPQQSPTL